MISFMQLDYDYVDDRLNDLQRGIEDSNTIPLTVPEASAFLKTFRGDIRAQIFIMKNNRCIVALDEQGLV